MHGHNNRNLSKPLNPLCTPGVLAIAGCDKDGGHDGGLFLTCHLKGHTDGDCFAVNGGMVGGIEAGVRNVVALGADSSAKIRDTTWLRTGTNTYFTEWYENAYQPSSIHPKVHSAATAATFQIGFYCREAGYMEYIYGSFSFASSTET